MTNEEFDAQKQRYEELLAKYNSDVLMTGDEIVEFVLLREIYGPVEEE